jgi:carbamoyltransferase
MIVSYHAHKMILLMQRSISSVEWAELEIGQGNGWEAQSIENPARVAADLIYQDKVIGWFQGRMEFGPRALGNRNIIAAPVDPKIKELINQKIKFREEFRPFAPAVLEEYAKEYFDCVGAGELVYPYMLAAVRVHDKVIQQIPAVVHADGTARIQTVSKSQNPLFWELIAEYKKRSGIPVVLSTSLNVKDEPIVHTITDAIQSLMKSGLDYLIAGNYLVRKTSLEKRKKIGYYPAQESVW